MSDISPRIALPYLAPSQAQKHVTHNEALQRLDVLTQLVIEEGGAQTPPTTPADGAIYALGTNPTEAWAGQAGQLAYWSGSAWLFLAPHEGWRAWDKATSTLWVYRGTEWQPLEGALQNLEGVGIGASFDPINRLAVAADATLLSHAGSGHQLKLNKADDADTASLLYQSNWTGHAEMGLTGDTDFRIKVSEDGSVWTDALIVDAGAGTVSGAAVQSSATDTGAGRLARADFTYGPGNLIGPVSESGGVPTGGVIESGSNSNGHYVRYADGTQHCFHSLSLVVSGPVTWTYAASFVDPPKVSGVAQQTTQALCFANEDAPTATEAKVSLLDTSDNRVGGTMDIMAIGRWF